MTGQMSLQDLLVVESYSTKTTAVLQMAIHVESGRLVNAPELIKSAA